jgi:hypothetical protein
MLACVRTRSGFVETATFDGLRQHGEDRAVAFVEPRPIDLALQHQHLMPQGENLRVAPVTCREEQAKAVHDQPHNTRERAAHDQPTYRQHDRPSSADTTTCTPAGPATSTDPFSAPSGSARTARPPRSASSRVDGGLRLRHHEGVVSDMLDDQRDSRPAAVGAVPSDGSAGSPRGDIEVACRTSRCRRRGTIGRGRNCAPCTVNRLCGASSRAWPKMPWMPVLVQRSAGLGRPVSGRGASAWSTRG